MKRDVAFQMVIALCLAVTPAIAQNDIYDNGPPNGNIDAWTINNGFFVSDSFILHSTSQVTGLDFTAWLFPGDVLESAEVSISSNPVSGTFYFDATINFTQSGCVANDFGFNVCLEQSDSFNGPILNAGTYWLNIQNAVVRSGDPVYWDENDGPSSAADSSLGSIASEAFTLLGGHGTETTSTTGTTPEPSSILLIGTGILGVAAVLRRRLF
jgi:hypothetical protein